MPVSKYTHSGLPLLPTLQGAMTTMPAVGSAEDIMGSSHPQDHLSPECKTEADHASAPSQLSSFPEIHEQVPEFLTTLGYGKTSGSNGFRNPLLAGLPSVLGQTRTVTA